MANMVVIRVLLSWLGTLLLVTGVYAVEDVKRGVGEWVTLKASYTGDPEEINWKLNSNKVVDFEVGKVPNFFHLRDRANITAAGNLTIWNLNRADSGLYKAEVVIGGYIHPTEIQLTVQDCPQDLRISNTTTDTGTVLTCHSSTQDVKYRWENRTGHVTEGQTYTLPQTRNQDDTVTCIVYNDVCSRNISLTIPRTPAAHGRGRIGIVVSMVVVIILIAAVLLYLCRKNIYSRIIRSNKADTSDTSDLYAFDESTKPENKEEPEQKRLIDQEADKKSAKRENIEELEQKLLTVKEADVESAKPDNNLPIPDTLIVETEGDPKSGSCGSVTFDLPPVEKVSHLEIRKDQKLLFWVEIGKISDDLLKRIVFERGSFTIRKVPEDETGQVNKKGPANETYTLEIHRTDKSPTSHTLQVTGEIGGGVEPSVGGSGDGEVLLWNADGEVKISLADPRDVTAVAWKKGDDLLLQWHVGDPKLQGEKFALSLSSLTINMEHGDNGSYQVDVYSTDKTVTSIKFRLDVISLKGKNSPRTIIMVRRETPEPPRRVFDESAKPETNVPIPEDPTPIGQRKEDLTLSIASVTLHPVSITKTGVISWKKEDTLLVERSPPDQRIHLHPNGDLTLKEIQEEDKGKYSVLCDKEILEEFHLRL